MPHYSYWTFAARGRDNREIAQNEGEPLLITKTDPEANGEAATEHLDHRLVRHVALPKALPRVVLHV